MRYSRPYLNVQDILQRDPKFLRFCSAVARVLRHTMNCFEKWGVFRAPGESWDGENKGYSENDWNLIMELTHRDDECYRPNVSLGPYVDHFVDARGQYRNVRPLETPVIQADRGGFYRFEDIAMLRWNNRLTYE